MPRTAEIERCLSPLRIEQHRRHSRRRILRGEQPVTVRVRIEKPRSFRDSEISGNTLHSRNLETRRREHNHQDLLPYVMHIAFDRADNDFA